MIALDLPRYFVAHRKAFGRLAQGQVEGLESILGHMREDAELTDIRHAAYMLATAWHETAQTMQPIAERGAVSYFNRYDPILADTAARRATARRMGNTRQGDGYRYRGRGYVQLTWKTNYARAGRALGVDLVNDPDRAMEPAIAYPVMSIGMREGWFTGRRLSDDLRDGRTDYVSARRIVNGTDRAVEIAEYARGFEGALVKASSRAQNRG